MLGWWQQEQRQCLTRVSQGGLQAAGALLRVRQGQQGWARGVLAVASWVTLAAEMAGAAAVVAAAAVAAGDDASGPVVVAVWWNES